MEKRQNNKREREFVYQRKIEKRRTARKKGEIRNVEVKINRQSIKRG